MASTRNTDVVGYISRIDRLLQEIMNSASSNTSQVKSPDLKRMKSYMHALRSYLDHISAEPELDLPESNPKEYAIEEIPELRKVENESMNDCCRLLELCRIEMARSQSTDLSSGIIGFDKERQLGVIEKIERFMRDYIEQVTPLDLPESSPRRPLSGQGLTERNS